MSVKHINPLINVENSMKYTNSADVEKEFEFENLNKVLAGNKIFTKDSIAYYNGYNRYGFIDPYNTEQICREFLFFTKPDLNIFCPFNDKGKQEEYTTLQHDTQLNKDLQNIPFFVDASYRHPYALRQLQYSVRDTYGVQNPFMYLLSNSVSSKLDLPGISAESRESTTNIMGTNIQYRGHSLKSDNGYDFSLSFNDTAYLEIYTMVKAYDEYMRLVKLGEVTPNRTHIINRIIPEQFSIYKFLISSDGETILYYAKLTGCYFTDVPRGDMGDPGNDGIKFSLSFHSQFVEDSNPLILAEFNRISPGGKYTNYADVYDYENKVVNNEWMRWPKIVKESDERSKRRQRAYDYRMKWIK